MSKSEVEDAKLRAVYGFPSRFETTFDVADQLSVVAAYDLPDDYLATYVRRMEAVGHDEIRRLADAYLKPESMTTLIVGDYAAIGRELKKLPDAGEVRHVDEDGNPVEEK